MSVTRAKWFFTALTLFVQATLLKFFPTTATIMYSYCALISILIFTGVIWALCRDDGKTPYESLGESLSQSAHALGHDLENNTAAPTRSMASLRLFYLDNLKTLLTVLVVLHHSLGAFGQGNLGLGIAVYHSTWNMTTALMLLNQGYFMCLFFFISAYFTPSSCDRKGKPAFIADKLKRLGIPFLVYMFILQPLLSNFVNLVVIGPESSLHKWSYVPSPLQCWFLCWLIIFNVAYTMIDADEQITDARLPGLCSLYGIGAGVGLLQLVQIAVGVWPMVPITFGSLPFDILFFVGGVLAKRNDWLTRDIPELFEAHGCTMYLTTVVTACYAIWCQYYVVVVRGGGGGLALQNRCGTQADTGSADASEGIITGVLGLSMGVYCVFCSLCALDLARRFLDFTGDWSRYLASASYGVYIIHPYAVVPLTGLCVAFLRSQGDDITFPDTVTVTNTSGVVQYSAAGSNQSTACINHPEVLWAGLAVVFFGSIVTCYPIAGWMRTLPGFNQVL